MILEILKLVFILVVLVFFTLLALFLYKGSMIYELITESRFNDIYEKTNNDAEDFLNKKIDLINFATMKNNIFNMTSRIHVNSIINSIFITGNSINPVLDIVKDKAKVLALLAKLKTIENYPVLNLDNA